MIFTHTQLQYMSSLNWCTLSSRNHMGNGWDGSGEVMTIHCTTPLMQHKNRNCCNNKDVWGREDVATSDLIIIELRELFLVALNQVELPEMCGSHELCEWVVILQKVVSKRAPVGANQTLVYTCLYTVHFQLLVAQHIAPKMQPTDHKCCNNFCRRSVPDT